MSSTIFRHSAALAGEMCSTFNPFFTMTFNASSFRFRISRWSFRLASRDTSRILGLSSAGILSHALLSMIVAPVSGAHLRSAMCGASANHWKARPARGVALKASISPVWREGRMSTTEIGTGRNPASLYSCVRESSPAPMYSFIAFTSAGWVKAFLAKKWTHPPSPQFRTMNPFSSRRPSSIGAIRSRTKSNSSSDPNIIGMCSP